VQPEVGRRAVRPGSPDVEAAADVLAAAFADDPLWAWATPDVERRPAQLRGLWRTAVQGAVRYPWTWLTEPLAAVAVWIPPGGTELSPEQEARAEDEVGELMGEHAGRVRTVAELLEAGHPHDEPHCYLSLLGTDPAQRGRGLGLALLAATLLEVDALGAAAYLEASNVANVPLYARYGFVVRDRLQVPGADLEVVTMWRDPVAGPHAL
jgi:ribosomal protein S18 acetylase RimI-like enzyme